MKSLFSIPALTALLTLSGCASVLDQDGASTITPYQIEKGGRIVIDAHVNSQGPFKFALDTAASISAIFDPLRNQLGLEPIPDSVVIIHGAVTTEVFPLLDVGLLEVGNEVWATPRIVSLPGNTAAGASFDGVLGVDFLRTYAIGFSVRDRVVRFYPPPLVAQRSYRGWASIPLNVVPIGADNAVLYFCDIEIDGQTIPAVFDLGAGSSLINWAAAHKLGIDPVKFRHDYVISGAIKNTPVAARLNVEEVTTGNIRWQNEVFTIADLEIFTTFGLGDSPAVILGAGFFTQRDFIIDFVRNRLLVKVSMKEVQESGNVTVAPRVRDHRQQPGTP